MMRLWENYEGKFRKQVEYPINHDVPEIGFQHIG